MKKIFTFLFVFLHLGNLFGQLNIEFLQANFQAGKTYAITQISSDETSDSIYIALIPPIFKDSMIKVKTIEKLRNRKDVEHETISKYYEIQPLALKWEKTELIDSLQISCLQNYGIAKKEFLILSLIEEVPKYMTRSLKVIKNIQNDDTSYFEYKTIIIKKKVADGMVKVLSSKDEILYSEQIVIAIPNGKWSPFKEVLCPVKVFEPSIATIQKALNQKGYKCQITGEMNEETRKVLVQFQKDNNFPSCGNSYELFKLLGLSVGF